MGKCIVKSGCVTILVMSTLFFLSTVSLVNASHGAISFDSLFPVTWYQKGLASSMRTWHMLNEYFDKVIDEAVVYDRLLAGLVYAQFCINRMIKEENACLREDAFYFEMVLQKLQGLIEMVVVIDENENFIMCAQEMIVVMQQQLSQLP